MPGRTIRTFTVLPHLPDRLRPLRDLAYNFWWCWQPEAMSLFRRIDPDLFEAVENSPVKLIGMVPQGRYDQLLADDGFLAHMDRCHAALEAYMEAESWFQEAFPETNEPDKPQPLMTMHRCSPNWQIRSEYRGNIPRHPRAF